MYSSIYGDLNSQLNDSHKMANSLEPRLALNKNLRSNSLNTPNTAQSTLKQTEIYFKTPQNILAIKNKLLCDLTRAIQSAQKAYLEKEVENQPLTNSDYQVHELCQQFDYVLLFG